MQHARRRFITLLGSTSALGLAPHAKAINPLPKHGINTLSDGEQQTHARFMRLAIAQAKQNKAYPFGAVIVETETGRVLAQGVNTGKENPTFHGEIVAMNQYVRRHGHQGWDRVTLYSTGEPCPMCMSALIWAGVKTMVWGSSVARIRQAGIPQFSLSALAIAASAAFILSARSVDWGSAGVGNRCPIPTPIVSI